MYQRLLGFEKKKKNSILFYEKYCKNNFNNRFKL